MEDVENKEPKIEETNKIENNTKMFRVDSEKTAKLIRALDNYTIQITSTMGSFLNVPFPSSAQTFLAYMDRVIVTFIERTFPDSEKRIKDYYNLREIYANQSKSLSFYFQYTSICQAMLIIVQSMREELLIHGLDFKTKLGAEQKGSIMEKVEEINRNSIEAGVPSLFKVKTEREEKKKLKF